MAYLAKYPNMVCVKCQNVMIPREHYITHSRKRGVQGGKRYMHVDCANPTVNPSAEAEAQAHEAEALESPIPSPTPASIEHPAPIPFDAPSPTPAPSEAASPTPAPSAANPMQVLAQGIEPYLSKGIDPETIGKIVETKAEAVKRDFDQVYVQRIESAKKELIDALDNYCTRIEVTSPSGQTVQIANSHPCLKRLFYLVSKRKHVFLHGPAGSGKSFGARQVAEASGLKYGFIALNDMTMPSALLGFQNVHGDYVRTPFRDCYENGGVFCIDEMDNANGNLLTTLNGALANGHCAFPDAIIERHPDFVCVGTGNTVGNGGDSNYSDRRAFDAATKDRFVFLSWPYDRKLERSIALSFNEDATPWINWVHGVRQFCESRYPNLIVSPRATFTGAEILKDSDWSIAEVAEAVLFKGLDKASIAAIVAANPYPDYKPSEANSEAA